jgi:hypothetical protein
VIRVEIQNDQSGGVEHASYDVSVTLPERGRPVTYAARVEGFERGRGWGDLVREAIAALEAAGVR